MTTHSFGVELKEYVETYHYSPVCLRAMHTDSNAVVILKPTGAKKL